MDGWVVVMHQGIDAVGIDMQPIENYNQWAIIFFVVFLLVVGFFVMSMFIGVLVENFKSTNEQLKEERRQRKLTQNKPQTEPKNVDPEIESYGPVRLLLYTIVSHKFFAYFIYTCIIVSVLFMASEHFGMHKAHLSILSYAAMVFSFIFAIEAILKILAFGKYYFYDRWNVMDFTIVLLSITAITIEQLHLHFLDPIVSKLLRAAQVFRVLRLVKMTDQLKELVITLGQALPQIGNLGLLLGLEFFIYAALGVELFGRIECSPQNPCDGLGMHASFHDFGMAFLTLFRVSTGDNWNGILKDTLKSPPVCDASAKCQTNCCASHVLAVVYFVTFVLMAQFILLNLVVAMLMKGFEESHEIALREYMQGLQNIAKIGMAPLPAVNSAEVAEAPDMSPDTHVSQMSSRNSITV